MPRENIKLDVDKTTLDHLRRHPYIYRAFSADEFFPYRDVIVQREGIRTYAYINPLEAMQERISEDTEKMFLAFRHEHYWPHLRTENGRLILGTHVFKCGAKQIVTEADFRQHVHRSKDFEKQLEYFLEHYLDFNVSLHQFQ